MTQRKPFALPNASWIDQQIQAAQRKGDFDRLPGAGKPLPKRDTSDPDWWLKQKVADEGLELALPPSLQLRKDVRTKLAAIALLTEEKKVREALQLLNERIRRANRASVSGPPTDLAPIPVERWIDGWRERRSR